MWMFYALFFFFLQAVVASILELIWWSLEGASTYANGTNNLEIVSTIGFVFSGCSVVVVTILLSSLSNNWLGAFVFLINGAGFSGKTEKIISIGIAAVIVGLSLLGLGFGVAFAVNLAAQADFTAVTRDKWRQFELVDFVRITGKGFEAVSTAFFSLCVCLAIFLVVSSAVGFVLLKRRGVSRPDLVGIARFFVIAFFLLVGEACLVMLFLSFSNSSRNSSSSSCPLAQCVKPSRPALVHLRLCVRWSCWTHVAYVFALLLLRVLWRLSTTERRCRS
jgi:hypothetical protein